MRDTSSWDFFAATGLPEAYLLYARSKTKESERVCKNQGPDHERDPLQRP